jgi:acetolactate synthase-1/2/3 large subunit
MLGMHGTIEANNAMQNCDVLLAVGARFDDRVIGNPKHFAQNERKIIHIDIDPSSISKRVKVDIPDRRRRQGCANRIDRHDQGVRPQA